MPGGEEWGSAWAETGRILTADPAVAEAAVVGRPDEIRGEVVEAFIVLQSGEAGGMPLVERLQALVRSHYGAHAYPRGVHFAERLPTRRAARSNASSSEG